MKKEIAPDVIELANRFESLLSRDNDNDVVMLFEAMACLAR